MYIRHSEELQDHPVTRLSELLTEFHFAVPCVTLMFLQATRAKLQPSQFVMLLRFSQLKVA